MSPSDDRIGPVFAALADPSRRQLVQHLATCESATLTELAATLPVSRQVVSKHLAALGEALTWVERVGVEWDDRLRALRDHLTT